jgi:hypothetical protein
MQEHGDYDAERDTNNRQCHRMQMNEPREYVCRAFKMMGTVPVRGFETVIYSPINILAPPKLL